MTATIAECAENARQCKGYASKTKNAEERKFLLRMANRWSETRSGERTSAESRTVCCIVSLQVVAQARQWGL